MIWKRDYQLNESKRDYFKKTVDINDPCLSAMYDIQFYVKYRDSVEDIDVWLVDEGQAVGLKENVENNEVQVDGTFRIYKLGEE